MSQETLRDPGDLIEPLPKLGKLAVESVNFLNYLENWLADLAKIQVEEVFAFPGRSAIFSVDVINGFCVSGPLASPRVGLIAQPIAELFERGWKVGLRNIILIQDSHEPDAVEFSQWPVHCVRGTAESEAVDDFKSLPFFSHILKMPKNSIHAGLHTGLNQWILAHPEVDTYIIVGDCTDLCTYQLAMHLRLDANARQLSRRVILPVNCVDTYDRPLDTAQAQVGFPHPADLLHSIFLYHLALNGVELAAQIC
jgi:nicotinamidase-related amidase